MNDDLLKTLLPALDIAVFERRSGGSFAAVAPPPPWFSRLTADMTFPFLGHILEEANDVWRHRDAARREWGPCAEVDDTGQEFHYTVVATVVDGRQYLLFQLDRGSDWIRGVLQKVRQQALASEQGHGSRDALTALQLELRAAVSELRDLSARMAASSRADERADLRQRVSAACDGLLNGVDALIRSLTASR
jgi:hypothetical protein